jgi:hypothetical protein
MKPTIAIAFLASTMILALSTASAQGKAKANIPFNFNVGSALLPAGTYLIEYTGPRVVWFHHLEGREHAVAVATTTSGYLAPPRKLVFNKYGDQYFLNETLTVSDKEEMTFAPSSREKSIRAEEASLHAEGRALIALK